MILPFSSPIPPLEANVDRTAKFVTDFTAGLEASTVKVYIIEHHSESNVAG